MARVLREKVCLLAGAMALAALGAAPAVAASKAGMREFQGALNSSSPKNDGNPYQVRTMPLEAGKRYALSAEASDFDPTLRVSFADDNDEPLAENDDGHDGTNSYIEFIPAKSGTYRLRVTALGSGTGNFVLKVGELPPLPPLLRPNPTGTSTVTFKHYNGALTASDGEIRGRLIDDYVFRFEGGKQVFLFLDSKTEDFDPMLEIYTAANRSATEALAADDDGGDELNAFVTFTPDESGDYIVRATSSGSDRAMGNYVLRVGQQP
jgi:hypothetical protein